MRAVRACMSCRRGRCVKGQAGASVAERPFSLVDALERVPGIGAKTNETIAPLVTVRD